MTLKDLEKEYDRLQLIYGDKNLHSIYNGGCKKYPDICFVFMNPTGKNIASLPTWRGIHSPWIGTKNIWNLFYKVGLLDEDIYKEIRSIKGSEWDSDFALRVYQNISDHKVFITNLGKCTQVDARSLSNKYFLDYLPLLEEEIKIVRPKVIILFGNQVSSIFLDKKITVSQVRKKLFKKKIDDKEYDCFSVFYPVGNGIFNIDKAIEDILWIRENYLDKE